MTTKTIASVGLALILTAIVSTGANARTHRQTESAPTFDRHASGDRSAIQVAGFKQIRKKQERQKYRKRFTAPSRIAAGGAMQAQIVAHPAGCPHRAFCGCGVSLHVFGKAVRAGGLAIAAEWLRFPRAHPAPGMVAARRGHVFAILDVRPGGMVLAYDPNSGRHQTRIHLRSLAGYTVVNPRGGSRYAEAR